MVDIAVVLFGMARKVAPFLDSIDQALFKPLRTAGLTHVVVGQLNDVDFISNPRSNEVGRPDPPSLISARFPGVGQKTQELAQIELDLAELSRFGDSWNDNFRSLANLLYQLHSLSVGTDMALASGAQSFIFLRPDLVYHDSFGEALSHAQVSPAPRLWVPDWQYSTGLNDRFAIARGLEAAETYGKRLANAANFVRCRNGPLHSERLLAYVVGTKGIPVEFLALRASRCRIDGTVKVEDHSNKWRVRVRTQARLKLLPKSFA